MVYLISTLVNPRVMSRLKASATLPSLDIELYQEKSGERRSLIKGATGKLQMKGLAPPSLHSRHGSDSIVEQELDGSRALA